MEEKEPNQIDLTCVTTQELVEELNARSEALIIGAALKSGGEVRTTVCGHPMMLKGLLTTCFEVFLEAAINRIDELKAQVADDRISRLALTSMAQQIEDISESERYHQTLAAERGTQIQSLRARLLDREKSDRAAKLEPVNAAPAETPRIEQSCADESIMPPPARVLELPPFDAVALAIQAHLKETLESEKFTQ